MLADQSKSKLENTKYDQTHVEWTDLPNFNPQPNTHRDHQNRLHDKPEVEHIVRDEDAMVTTLLPHLSSRGKEV